MKKHTNTQTHILLFTITFILISLYSCNKDDVENHSQDTKDISVYQDDIFPILNEFDFVSFSKCSSTLRQTLGKPSFEKEFGFPSDKNIVFKNGANSSLIVPLIKDNKIENLLWVNSLNSIYILKRTNYYSNEDIEGTGISRKAFRLFDLSPEDLRVSASSRHITEKIGDEFTINNYHNILIINDDKPNEFNYSNIIPNQRIIKAICPIPQDIIDFYYINLGLFGEFGPDYNSIPLNLMTDAASSIANSGACNCPSTCKVLQVLTNSTEIDQSVKDHINTTWLGDTFIFPIYDAAMYVNDIVNYTECQIKALLTYVKNTTFDINQLTGGNSPYGQSNDCEKALMQSHPLCASSIASNWLTANIMTRRVYGYNLSNECSDAFRHTTFNALNSIYCGEGLARQFGEARECTSDCETATIMDLFNNDMGFVINNDNPSIINKICCSGNVFIYHQGLQELTLEICNQMIMGNLLVFEDPSVSCEDADNGLTSLIDSDNCSCSL